MTIVNMTPHSIKLVTASGTMQYAPVGLARVSQTQTVVGEVDGVKLVNVHFGEVVGLPEPVTGTLYIVSAMVREACKSRTDLASPGDLVRDADGNIQGCKSLILNPL